MSDAERQMRESMEVKGAFLKNGGAEIIEKMAEAVLDALRAGRRVYICGNGGSAADAQHIAAEFVGRFMFDRDPLPCVALSTNTSILTAIGNDYSFDDIFERQVNALVQQGDVLIGISTSGNSANVLRAVRTAGTLGATTLAFSGRDGGQLAEIAEIALVAPAQTSPRIQELHITCAHILCDLVEKGYFGERHGS